MKTTDKSSRGQKESDLFLSLQRQGISIDQNRLSCAFLQSNAQSADAKADEDEAYFYAPFRALSATLVHWGDMVFDFSKEGVLKKAVKLLSGQTVYKDHSRSVDDWLGKVVASKWDESEAMPAGINVRLRINKKWNEKLIDGIKDGSLDSVSVTVSMEYERSHPHLEDFFWKMGAEVDGQIVRLIVTKVISFGEISLVWSGADPYAKKLPAFSQEVKGLSEQQGSHALKADGLDDQKNNKNEKEPTMKLTKYFIALFGLVAAQFGLSASKTEVELTEELWAILRQELESKFAEQKKIIAKQEEVLSVLFGQSGATVESAKAVLERAQMGDAYLKSLREDTVKFAKVSEGGEISAAMEKMILAASLEDAQKLKADFEKKAEEKFPLRCPSCQTPVSRSSAASGSFEQSGADIAESDYQF